MALAVDRIFTASVKLSGKAIVEFVGALCEVSWDEITSSSDREHPRMYCLQRLVEISYYNMKRIRVEWSNIWNILGEHFNQVGSHPNPNVGFFALDKLRQLAMKFLELEELPHFKFQKDFLKPFEHVIGNNPDVKIKDMVLVCLQQMIQAKAKSMKSGWKALFAAFIKAAREPHESIVQLAFDIVKGISKNNFENVVLNQTFADYISCLVEFCKNKKFPKTSLQAVEMLRQSITRMAEFAKSPQFHHAAGAGTGLGTAAGGPLRAKSFDELREAGNTKQPQTPSGGEPLAVPVGGGAGKGTAPADGVGKTNGIAAPLLPPQPISATSAAHAHQNANANAHALPSPASHPPNSARPQSDEEPNYRFWFPILFGLYEVIMTCDLEVRTRGLTYLFDTLKTYGASYPRDFWEVISKGVLFPIFDDLKLSRQEHTKFANKEDMSVWLSTTLIQALRQFVDLFTFYFETLKFMIDGLLDLLTVCMTQENETLARIGSTCLQQFIENNVSSLNDEIWDKICKMFIHLFEVTTPHALFFEVNGDRERERSASMGVQSSGEAALGMGVDGDEEANAHARIPSDAPDHSDAMTLPKLPEGEPDGNARTTAAAAGLPNIQPMIIQRNRPRPQKKDFQQIIVKCVLHLLVIQTLHEVLTSGTNDTIYRSLSSRHLFLLIDCLERSYRFAQTFNGDMELRMALYKMGFMKSLPNLLKQETSSVSSYILILIKMYSDGDDDRVMSREEIAKRLIPLSYDILHHYNSLDPESKRRNVNAWRPVVVTILNALVNFDDSQFQKHIPVFYGEVVNLLLQDVPQDIRLV
ncbi:guanine nucleotide exchange protein for ADP-robosylation factor, partial [Quaeritorhiza haematococci]